MAECAKKGEYHFWDWGLSYEARFVTIGWKLWEKTSQNPKKALDNYYIDRRGWLSVPKSSLSTAPWTQLSGEVSCIFVSLVIGTSSPTNLKKALDNYIKTFQSFDGLSRGNGGHRNKKEKIMVICTVCYWDIVVSFVFWKSFSKPIIKHFVSFRGFWL